MDKKDVSSFKIVQHHKHSWSYAYIIDGKRRISLDRHYMI